MDLKNNLSPHGYAPYLRAGHGLTQSVAISTVVEIDQDIGLQRCTVSPLGSRKPFDGFPYCYYNMACFLDVRTIKSPGECAIQINQRIATASRLLLPVDCYCQ